MDTQPSAQHGGQLDGANLHPAAHPDNRLTQRRGHQNLYFLLPRSSVRPRCNGPCYVFTTVEPLTGWRHKMTERRTLDSQLVSMHLISFRTPRVRIEWL